MKLLCGKRVKTNILCCHKKCKKLKSFMLTNSDNHIINPNNLIYIKINFITNTGFKFIEDTYVLKWNSYTYGLVRHDHIAVSIPIYEENYLIDYKFISIPKIICEFN